MGKSITKTTSDLPHWGNDNQLGALRIKYSKLGALKRLFTPFPGIHFFVRFPFTEDKEKIKSNLSLSAADTLLASHFPPRKIYLTDMERNLTFAGIVESLEELKGIISVSLLDVQVYDYSSSTPLYHLPKISFSRPKDQLHQEEF